jgi:hypothetical protein
VLKYDEETVATAPAEEVDGEEADDDDEAAGLAEGLGTGRPTPKTVLKFGGESATETETGPFGDDDNGGEGIVPGPEEDDEAEVEFDILDPIELPTDAELEIVVSGGRGTWMFSPVPEPEPDPAPVAVAETETEPADKDRVKRGIEKSFCGAAMGGDMYDAELEDAMSATFGVPMRSP